MWWFAAGNKTTQALIESASISIDLSNSSVQSSFLTALSTNHGVAEADISFYYLADTDPSVTRVHNGDSWALTWSGSAPTGEVSGVSFATEDAKKWLQFSANKTGVLANNKDILTVSITMLTANKSGTDTTFSGDLDIPVSTPDGGTKARFVFVSGKSSKNFKFSKSGYFSAGSKMTNYRMDNTLTVEILL